MTNGRGNRIPVLATCRAPASFPQMKCLLWLCKICCWLVSSFWGHGGIVSRYVVHRLYSILRPRAVWRCVRAHACVSVCAHASRVGLAFTLVPVTGHCVLPNSWRHFINGLAHIVHTLNRCRHLFFRVGAHPPTPSCLPAPQGQLLS